MVMEKGEDVKSLGMPLLYPLLEKVWTREGNGFQVATKEEYLEYVTRDPELPEAFKEAIDQLRSVFMEAEPNAKQIHGDLTLENVVRLRNGELRFIDFSIRKEVPFREADISKFLFSEFRWKNVKPLVSGLSPLMRFFVICHFCRVWTRDKPARIHLEKLFQDFITRSSDE